MQKGLAMSEMESQKPREYRAIEGSVIKDIKWKIKGSFFKNRDLLDNNQGRSGLIKVKVKSCSLS